jgi:hypothetical protein
MRSNIKKGLITCKFEQRWKISISTHRKRGGKEADDFCSAKEERRDELYYLLIK